MHRFWDTIIEPVLRILQPKGIVEIGSDDGKNTRNLLEFCEKHGATLQAIDPLPKFDVPSWQERYGKRFIFHQSLSLNAIPKIDQFDVILIDGDHNWYTVFNELKLIERRCIALSQPFPLVMLHDVGWPYGRRDLYYNPENIPDGFRKPYKQKGMRPGSTELLEKGGLNVNLCNSIYENDLKSGVLTAIDDFLAETQQELEFVKVPALHGLGILFPFQQKQKKSEFRKFLKELSMSAVTTRILEYVEKNRIEITIDLEEKRRTLKESEAKQKGEIECLQGSLEERTELVKAKEEELSQIKEALQEAEAEIGTGKEEAQILQAGINEREEALKKRDEELTAIQRDLAESKESEAKRSEEVESLQSELQTRTAALEAKEAEVKRLQSELQESLTKLEGRETEVECLQNELKERDCALEAKGTEVANMEQRLAAANRTLSEKDQQFSELKRKLKERFQDVDMLIRWIDQLDLAISALLSSRRWRFGNAAGDFLRRIRFKGRVPMVTDHLQALIGQFKEWRERDQYTDYENKKQLNFQGAIGSASPERKRTTNGQHGDQPVPHTCSEAAPGQLSLHHRKAVFDNFGRGVTIIVPIFNAYEEVSRCLKKLVRYTDKRHEIFLVDDSSTDNRIYPLILDYERKYKNIRSLKNKENLGYTKTINITCSAANRNDVVLLNSDTQVTPNWVEKLNISAYSEENIATVTPLSNAAGAFSIPENNKINALPEGISVEDMNAILESVSKRIRPKVPTGNGFCLYVTRKALDEVGLFDEVSFPKGYGEENDFCMRCLEKGFYNLIDDSTYIFHERSGSFKENKSKIYSKAQEVLENKHPLYKKFVSEWLCNDPLDPLRRDFEKHLKGMLKGNINHEDHREFTYKEKISRNAILYIIHDGHGGTIYTNRDLLNNVSARHKCLLLSCNVEYYTLYEVVGDEFIKLDTYQFDCEWRIDSIDKNRINVIRKIVQDHDISLVHIRHLLGVYPEIVRELYLMNRPVVFSFHDFYVICPTIQLINSDKKYCAGSCDNGRQDCAISKRWFSDHPRIKNDFVHEWRKKWGEALPFCAAYITASEFAKRMVQSFYNLDDNIFHVVEHGRDYSNFVPVSRVPQKNERVDIVCFGDLALAKGIEFVKRLISFDRKMGAVFRFHLLGKTEQNLYKLFNNDRRSNAKYYGRYERDELPMLLEKIRPSFSMVASIWPETYCHTLTESWLAQLPVFASNIGVIRDRVLRHDGGWVLNIDDVEASYNLMVGVVNDKDEYLRKLENISRIRYPSTDEMSNSYMSIYSDILVDSGAR